jgi:23S rRNA pseudouridine1911/1915/1917 synthase
MAALAPGVSRGEARRLIAAGVVFVAGRRTHISSRSLREGERISWEPPARAQPDGWSAEPRLVIERPQLWLIDKPAGMPVEPTRAGSKGTLVAWLRRQHGPAFVTHRLDAATSGLIVVARDRHAQAELNRLFAAHTVGRRYLAVVAPAPAWMQMTFDGPLDGRTALTHATVVARSASAAALVVELATGRTRQIRRHLGDAGWPVVGDTAAGGRTRGRLLLHAFELILPRVGAELGLSAIAPAPPDFVEPATILGLTLPELPPGGTPR